MVGARFSNTSGTEISYSFWLVFDAAGGVRLTRGEPDLKRGERGMSCTAALPKALFRTPELKAKIAVNETIPSTLKIDVAAASEALKQIVGCDIDLRVERPAK